MLKRLLHHTINVAYNAMNKTRSAVKYDNDMLLFANGYKPLYHENNTGVSNRTYRMLLGGVTGL